LRVHAGRLDDSNKSLPSFQDDLSVDKRNTVQAEWGLNWHRGHLQASHHILKQFTPFKKNLNIAVLAILETKILRTISYGYPSTSGKANPGDFKYYGTILIIPAPL
jgi:hypothetical protein